MRVFLRGPRRGRRRIRQAQSQAALLRTNLLGVLFARFLSLLFDAVQPVLGL